MRTLLAPMVALLVVVVISISARAKSIDEILGFEPRFVLPADTRMVSIKAFGAVGDGVTDDTAAFLKAFGTNEPRAIYLPAGTYLVREQIRYGVQDTKKKKVTLIGESRSRTIIRLADDAPGFGDPSSPRAFIHTRHPKQQGEQNMHMYVLHLTIEIGRGNPGAIALEYHSNNTGAVKDVLIRTADPAGSPGAVGLSCSEWEVGPANLRYVTVEGFRTGIQLSKIGNYVTLEHVTVRHCQVGLDTRTSSIRGLHTADCALPVKASGQVVILDSDLRGPGAVAISLADKGSLLARNVATNGFEQAVGGQLNIRGERLQELIVGPSLNVGEGQAQTLALPIAESPERQYPQSPGEWAVMPASGDISQPLQAAIDGGVRTIYFQGGGGTQISRTIHVRNKVERLMGLGNAYITFKTGEQPAFILEDGEPETVFCELVYSQYGSNERVQWQHASKRTLVYRHGSGSYESTDAAKGARVFIESVVGHPFHFNGVHAWVRDIDTEMGGVEQTNIVNRDGRLWILGHKTEDFATKIATFGGSTELLGGTYRQNWDQEDFDRSGIANDRRPPLFLVEDGEASFTYVSWGPAKEYSTLIRTKRNGASHDVMRQQHGGSAALAVVRRGRE